MLKIKTVVLMLILVMIMGLLSGCGGTNDAAEIKIGMIGPLSGDYTSYGLSTLCAAPIFSARF